MNYRLFCIFSLFFCNIVIHSLVEKTNVQVPDFRWTKTVCSPTYGYWMNNVNNARYYDIHASPYEASYRCWVFRDEISFVQPILPYEVLVFLDIFFFVVGLLFF